MEQEQESIAPAGEAPPPAQPAAVAAEAPTEPAAEPAAPTEPAAAAEPPAPAPELTDEQRAMLEAFKAIDADGDGELTADEIYQALAKNDANVNLERIHEIMEKADKDHNGTISQQEYMDAVAEDILPPSWLGSWLGKVAKGVAAAFAGPEPEPVPTVDIDAPQGALGLARHRVYYATGTPSPRLSHRQRGAHEFVAHRSSNATARSSAESRTTRRCWARSNWAGRS